MKRYYVLSFIAGALSMFLALAIIANVIVPNRSEEQKEYEHIDFASEITSDQCYICGTGSDCEYWGEENIAILNLKCFKMLRLEINRYDDQKQLIEEPYGYMVKGGLYENDTYINSRSHPDKGYATVEITSLDYEVDRELVQKKLCQTCLDVFNKDWYSGEPLSEFAVIGLKDRSIHPLHATRAWFSVGEFGVDCEYEDDGDIDMLVHCIDNRYGDPEQ